MSGNSLVFFRQKIKNLSMVMYHMEETKFSIMKLFVDKETVQMF